jgi:hypothetical protein
MALGRIIDIFAAIVSVALVTVIVTSPNTSAIIDAWGKSFSSSLSAAMGK